MAILSDGFSLSNGGYQPAAQIHTYDWAGTLLPDGTRFDAPLSIVSSGGSGCLSATTYSVQTTNVGLVAFSGSEPPPGCSYANYGITAIATSPFSATTSGLLSVGPANPLNGLSIQFSGLSRLHTLHPMSFTFAPEPGAWGGIKSTNCPTGLLEPVSIDPYVLQGVTISPIPTTFDCSATFTQVSPVALFFSVSITSH